MRPTAVLFSVGFLVGTATLHGQSLADVARQEAERRKAISAQARVYTNRDLGEAPAAAMVAPAPPPTSTPASGASTADGKSGATADGDDKAPIRKAESEPNKFRDENQWRERARQYRAKMEKLRADVAAIQSRAEELRAGPQTPANASDLKLSEQDLVRYKNQLAYIEKEWAGIEQKAREDKVPATWLQ